MVRKHHDLLVDGDIVDTVCDVGEYSVLGSPGDCGWRIIPTQLLGSSLAIDGRLLQARFLLSLTEALFTDAGGCGVKDMQKWSGGGGVYQCNHA